MAFLARAEPIYALGAGDFSTIRNLAFQVDECWYVVRGIRCELTRDAVLAAMYDQRLVRLESDGYLRAAHCSAVPIARGIAALGAVDGAGPIVVLHTEAGGCASQVGDIEETLRHLGFPRTVVRQPCAETDVSRFLESIVVESAHAPPSAGAGARVALAGSQTDWAEQMVDLVTVKISELTAVRQRRDAFRLARDERLGLLASLESTRGSP